MVLAGCDERRLLQRLRDEHGDRIDVLGIDWQDTQPGNPVALLVDADGTETFRLMRIDTYDQLPGLVRDHTGVTVAAG